MAKQGLNTYQLKILALFFMFLDHLHVVFFKENSFIWLRCLGRLSFPIFAFLLTEGFFYTKDFSKYLKRMFIFALISEIPFDLMTSGTFFNFYSQNIMFSFCIALIGMYLLEKLKKYSKLTYIISSIYIVIFMFILATITFTDYAGSGLLIIFLFYFTKKIKYKKIIQLIGMFIINIFCFKSPYLTFNLFSYSGKFPLQGMALFSLIFIFFYHGQLGPKSKYFFYLFYPLHMLLLYLLKLILI